MSFTPDSSGIKSLAGFSFQIKVFCCLAAELKEGQQIEFESIDDVATSRNCKADKIDNLNGQILVQNYESIQVKHTKLSKSLANKVLYNWIQIENSSCNISRYTLITDEKYNNSDLLGTINIDDFINEVMSSTKKANANIAKVKKILNDILESERKTFIENILKKHDFKPINIDDEIVKNYKDKLLKSANEVVFYQRLDELLSEITNRILESINNLKPYLLTYTDFQKILNNVFERFSVDVSLPSYNNFKTVTPIDLKSTEIANSREYRQLQYCSISENFIRRYLLQEQYYKKVRNNYLDLCMESKCGDIEITAYENFEDVKEELQANNNDTSSNRFWNTTKASNSYAENEQIRKGVCIYLTSDNVSDGNQISWKDE
jgi:hypothetical protein